MSMVYKKLTRLQISVLNTPGDYKAHWIDILPNGALSFNRTVDFEAIFTKDRGGARPHSRYANILSTRNTTPVHG
jgi:selenium-binding protein 1